MKIDFIENKWGVDIILTPETPAEVSQLSRFTLNAAAVKPDIYLSFSNDPVCYVYLKKRKESWQINSINSNKK